jgi:hypothetical protein
VDPQDPEIANLNDQISEVVCQSSRKAWIDKVTCSKKQPCSVLGFTLQFIWQVCPSASKQAITFGDKNFSNPQFIAKKFNSQFTSIAAKKQDPESCKVNRDLSKKHKLGHEPFTYADTVEAIRLSSNSTAIGPDGLTSLHFKHLGPIAISYLTKLFNLSLSNADLPSIWKVAHIIHVPKIWKTLPP